VRRTLDWGSEAFTPDWLVPELQAKCRTWGETFEMSYPAFRQRLKDIALENHARVEDAMHTPFEEIPEGDLVVPTDDDDWFAPSVVHEIRAAWQPDAEGCLWHRQVISASRRSPKRQGWLRMRTKKMGGHHSCATNNYAIVKRSDRRRPDMQRMVTGHTRAAEFVDAHPRRFPKVRKWLAIQNRSMASKTALQRKQLTTTREELVERYERYRAVYADWPLSPELQWARPCLDLMAALMDEIRVR
jgi:hypothetical protein